MSKRVYLDRKGSKQHVGRASRRVKRKNLPPNRYLMEGEEASTSASSKRLKTSEDVDIEVDASFGYRILNFISVFSTISNSVKCKRCDGSVKFTETSIRGLGFKVKMSCESCDPLFINSSPLINGMAYDINRRIVFAFRLLGIGLTGLEKFCGIMDLPKPTFRSIYAKLMNNIHTAADTICELSMKRAVQNEKETNREKGDKDEFTVSGDVAWRKPDFSSLFSVSKIVAYYTGKIIDIAINFRNCKACEFWKGFEDTEEYNEWRATHEDECSANYERPTGKIGMAEMFSRSEEKYGVKYSNYIDNEGDSRIYDEIVDSKPYGDVLVKRKQSIVQAQTRMITELRKVKKENRSFPNCPGMLTAKLIDELTAYYGFAIRNSTNSVEELKNLIWAGFYHKISTDKIPQHDKCPSGEDSWCSWQKAKANGTLKSYKHEDPVSVEVQKAVRPVYEMLSTDDLLESCLGGFEQSDIESTNTGIWSMVPKVTLNDEKIVEIAAYIATSIFNDGYNNILLMMQVLNLTIGPNSKQVCENLDEHRITIDDLRDEQAAREAKKLEKAARKEIGDSTLVPGGSL